RLAVRASPSWVRANTWIRSRISALLGRSDGLTDPRQSRWAALRFAVKYSDSLRAYMRRAASKAIARRSFASAMKGGATALFDEPVRCRREARGHYTRRIVAGESDAGRVRFAPDGQKTVTAPERRSGADGTVPRTTRPARPR